MSSFLILLLSFAVFAWAYFFYAKRFEAILGADPKKPTPAFSKFDSVDYIPAKNVLVLFGHHFSSIAGAGPIIGPVIAVMLWGWLPALLWVIIGTVFIGGIHDFGSLVVSIKQGGSSVADVSQHVISKRVKIIFSLFVWLALILVIAVFAWFCADTFVKEPKIVLPSLGLIPVAILCGYLLYVRQRNLASVTALGLLLLVGLIFVGNILPIKAGLNIWLFILLFYCYLASILPVNILLQPRDYLSSYLLFFGLGMGYICLLFTRPPIEMPFYHNWVSSEGYLWPALFVTVACGAVSGFHSLIASGTTSKQISNEAQARKIGYGAMVVEAMLAILAVLSVAVLFNSRMNFAAILKSRGPSALFGDGYGYITKPMLGSYGLFVAITILNAFILTTLDTATRITRYISEELFKIKNKHISTAFVIFLAGMLAFSGKWSRIWPVFGASNQLVAALSLFVLASWLIAKHKTIRFVLAPAIFMLITTLVSLLAQARRYFISRDIMLLIIVILLMGLAFFMILEVVPLISKRRRVNV
ncbi:MAG: carbon starvation protein A [Candidatus Omnitrophota bacterium]|jgi:carbon starvation protein|nr:MAG: carbon starvation protein A [Candidatus Omnitrophota bacterium]